jgi:long-subunit fatty acid transport protein
MKLRHLVVLVGIACAPRLALAGGLLLPGAGAVSTARAGAAVASADDGEAVSLNPAGIAKARGTTITISAAIFDYAMQFQRRGSYDAVAGQDYGYAGQPYAAVRNDAQPPSGIGHFQPVPVFAVISDLGGVVPGLHVGLGFYAPSAYPFRDMCTELATGCQKYAFNRDTSAPPATRYDIMKQEAAITAPSIVVAYQILPELDVGARFSAARASIKSTTALWATAGPNYQEDVAKDGTFSVDAKDNFIPGYGFGATYRPTANLELGFNYTSELDLHLKGTSVSQLGPAAGLPGLAVTLGPTSDAKAQCATGGTDARQNACIDFALPRNAQLGGRYKFLDAGGAMRGDVELDLDWENWGKSCSADDLASGACTSPSEYRVVADTSVYYAGSELLPLNQSIVHHNLRDTFGVRVGGSYHLPIGPRPGGAATHELIFRGGVGYETAAARPGWLRADLDGAARTTLTAGAAYRMPHAEFSIGGGAILEGSPDNPNIGGAEPCNPTSDAPICGGTADHQGPDPINPLVPNNQQAINPISQGSYKAHYTMFMLGVTTWF